MASMDTFYLISDSRNPDKPIHIKINNEIGGAVLGFLNKQTADFYISKLRLPQHYQAFLKSEISLDTSYYKENLLIFKNTDQISEAYKDQNNYEWSQLLTTWT
jgi:hypothetical protein